MEVEPSLSMKVGMTFAYIVTFIVGFFGNGIGMYVVCKCNGGVKTVTNLLIANMAFADLLVTLLSMPTTVAQMYISNKWLSGSFGTLTCKLVYSTFFLSLAASVFTIVFISAERYVAIFFPLRGDSLKMPKLLTFLIWVLAFLMISPILIMFKTKQYEPMGAHYCVTEWPWLGDGEMVIEATLRVLKHYFIAAFVILYCFPVLLVGFLYSLISLKLWFVTTSVNHHKSHRAALQKSRKKVVKLLIAIVVVFTVCFFPAHLMHYYLVFRFDIYVKIEHWGYVLYWISQANSSINPCLYILLNDRFRHDFLKVLSRGRHIRCCRKMSSCSRRRVKPRIRSHNSSSSHSQQRRLSFMQLLQVVRGTFSSAFNVTPSARLTGETRLARNSLTPMNHAKIAADTRF